MNQFWVKSVQVPRPQPSLILGLSACLWLAIAPFSNFPGQAAPRVVPRQERAQAPNPQAYYGQGNKFYQQGEFKQAIAAYQQAIRLHPNYAEAYVGLGNALDDSGSPYAAITAYNRAISLEPNAAVSHYNLGITQYRIGKYQAAATAFKKTVELDPRFVRAYTNLGNALDDLGEFEAAVQAYQQALELDPDSAGAYFNLGIAFSRQPDRRRDAIAAFQKARELYKTVGNPQTINRIDEILKRMVN